MAQEWRLSPLGSKPRPQGLDTAADLLEALGLVCDRVTSHRGETKPAFLPTGKEGAEGRGE